MPELPEVEAARHTLRRVLKGRTIRHVVVQPDPIVFDRVPPEAIESALVGRQVKEVGRKGKFFWLELDRTPWLFAHFGMSGHVHTLDDEDPAPRFCKLIIASEGGPAVAFTDGRRLGRIWLAESPLTDHRIRKLGFDCLDELPDPAALHEITRRRKTAIKALLLNQSVFAGVGNYMADEALYHARIAPQRLASSLSRAEVARLRDSIEMVTTEAVKATTSDRGLPTHWLFHKRWGKRKGEIDGHEIAHDTVGGRTTAWVPGLQR